MLDEVGNRSEERKEVRMSLTRKEVILAVLGMTVGVAIGLAVVAYYVWLA